MVLITWHSPPFHVVLREWGMKCSWLRWLNLLSSSNFRTYHFIISLCSTFLIPSILSPTLTIDWRTASPGAGCIHALCDRWLSIVSRFCHFVILEIDFLNLNDYHFTIWVPYFVLWPQTGGTNMSFERFGHLVFYNIDVFGYYSSLVLLVLDHACFIQMGGPS